MPLNALVNSFLPQAEKLWDWKG